MIKLVFPGNALAELRGRIWHEHLESVAILLCLPVRVGDDWRLILRETHVVPPDAYDERTKVSAVVKPGFGLPIEKTAKLNGWSLVYCHTHPGQLSPARFSKIDDAAERLLGPYADSRSPGVPHCALLFSKESTIARRLGSDDAIRVFIAGDQAGDVSNVQAAHDGNDLYDRQIRAFGEVGQANVRRIRVAIVGLGGTGSVIAQQLAHLGVQSFLLVDRDVVEASNLNRTVGATKADIGATKVAVAERMILSIQPAARVRSVVGDVVDEEIAKLLLSADFIFSCTDSHASRHLINQMAFQYAMPAIDMGVSIDTAGDKQVRFAGHAKALAPGLPCLWCLNNLDARQIREELMSPEQRQADPYFQGGQSVVQPAVISINSTIASSALTMFLSMVAGVDAPARYLIYDGNRQRLAPVDAKPDSKCNFCGPDSTALTGDKSPLPVRRHGAS